jgi:hypothetical protein
VNGLKDGVENFEIEKIEQNIELVNQYHISMDQETLEKAYEIIDET